MSLRLVKGVGVRNTARYDMTELDQREAMMTLKINHPAQTHRGALFTGSGTACVRKLVKVRQNVRKYNVKYQHQLAVKPPMGAVNSLFGDRAAVRRAHSGRPTIAAARASHTSVSNGFTSMRSAWLSCACVLYINIAGTDSRKNGLVSINCSRSYVFASGAMTKST